MISLHKRIKRVLISGGSRGIGLSVGKRLLDQGAEVFYCSRHSSNFEHPGFRHIPADLSQGSSGTEAVIDYFSSRNLALDALICAAGGIHEALIPRQDDATVEQQLTLNMTSHMRLIRWAIGPMMLQRFGRIVAVSSTAARFPAPGQSVYAAAKAGLEAFLKGCAMEFARKGITCNCVVPGYILTDFSKDYLMANGVRKVVPMERAGEVEEAAEAVLVFLGQHSDYLTGSQIVVDGGLSLAVKRSQ